MCAGYLRPNPSFDPVGLHWPREEGGLDRVLEGEMEYFRVWAEGWAVGWDWPWQLGPNSNPRPWHSWPYVGHSDLRQLFCWCISEQPHVGWHATWGKGENILLLRVKPQPPSHLHAICCRPIGLPALAQIRTGLQTAQPKIIYTTLHPRVPSYSYLPYRGPLHLRSVHLHIVL